MAEKLSMSRAYDKKAGATLGDLAALVQVAFRQDMDPARTRVKVVVGFRGQVQSVELIEEYGDEGVRQ